jgi:tRNA G18 (ribose-2'-O)-methylase SpoU
MGLYNVRRWCLPALEASEHSLTSGDKSIPPHRLVTPRSEPPDRRTSYHLHKNPKSPEAVAEQLRVDRETRLDVACETFRRASAHGFTCLRLSTSAFEAVLRNVPASSAHCTCNAESETPCQGDIVTVAYAAEADVHSAPSLVLCDLKYRGNIGTILRAAVQANFFKAVHIIGSYRQEPTESDDHVWAKNKWKGVTDDEMRYYSLGNAALVDVHRYTSVAEFEQAQLCTGSNSLADVRADVSAAASCEMSDVSDSSKIHLYDAPPIVIGVDVIEGRESLSLYTREALLYLRNDQATPRRPLMLVMGGEDTGIPPAMLQLCDKLVHIPCLSASINVTCAFMAVLTAMQLSLSVESI